MATKEIEYGGIKRHSLFETSASSADCDFKDVLGLRNQKPHFVDCNGDHSPQSEILQLYGCLKV